jgi:uncharacterized membrane protein
VRPTILGAVAVAAALASPVVASCGGGSDSGSSSKAASLEEVQKIAEQRCVPCHSANPTIEGYEDGPPAGLELDKAENIEARKDRIYELVVVRKEMPFVNQTRMTQAERDRFASWYRAEK